MGHLDEEPALPGRTPGKAPLHINAFEMARRANCTLIPLFPYTGPGDIVPCTAVLYSDGKPRSVGYFVHTNSVDEVALTLGGDGRLRTGDVHVGPRSHGVGGDTTAPFYAVMVITQRQLDEGDQPEALAFNCEKCSAEIFRYEFGKEGYAETCEPVLPSINGSLEAAEALNNSEANRHCQACGHDNPPFPLPFWGWAQHVHASKITKRGLEALEGAGRK